MGHAATMDEMRRVSTATIGSVRRYVVEHVPHLALLVGCANDPGAGHIEINAALGSCLVVAIVQVWVPRHHVLQ